MDLVTAGLLLIVAGFAMVMISSVSRRGGTDAEVRGGGVVMVGPIPIIFGSDMKWAGMAIVLAIVLMLVYLLLWVI